MKVKLPYRLLFILFVNAVMLPSKAQELYFDKYSMEDGLSHPGTFFRESILQDREGFIWISTLNGLNRFDGKTFKIFQFDGTTPNSLNSNLITGLCEAEDGKIWVGTSTGINIFDPELETFELLQHDPSDPNSLCGNAVNFIHKDQDGNMWVGTQKSGICRWDINTKTFDDFDGFFSHGLVVFQQKNGTVWLGNHDGLFRYIPENHTFQTINMPQTENDARKQPAGDICELPNGNLLIASTWSGLWEFNPDKLVFNDISAGFASRHLSSPACLICDQNGMAWMGGVGELFRYESRTGTFTGFSHEENDPENLPMFTIVDAYEDRAGSLWFHLIGEGLRVAHTVDNPFKAIGKFSVSQALHLDGKRVLMYSDQGLKVFDLKQEQFIQTDIPLWFRHPRGRSIALSVNKETLYIRNPNKDEIYQYDFKTRKSTLLPYKGWLKSDKKGRPWIKLNYFEAEQNKWINLRPVLETRFPELAADPWFGDEVYFNDKNSLWLKTKKGVLHYNIKTKEGKHYLFYPNDSLAIVEIHAIFSGSAGRFYCFSSNGLSIFNPEIDAFEHFSEKNGLLHNQAQAIVEDATGNPWIGSPKGLQKLDWTTKTFTNYGRSDGLPGETILHQAPFRDSLGFLYYSIAGKLVRFHPDSLKVKDYAPPVHLLDFYVNRQIIEPLKQDSILPKQLRFSKEINLTYQQSDFGFSFVMPVFYKADEVDYYYQLFPYEKEWQNAGSNRQVHYTNIDPGSYTFQVKAKTAAGFWNSNEATILVAISPPWWTTQWAYLVYALLFFLITYSLYRFVLYRQLEKAESTRLKELDSLKTRLYTNITHEFRTPLTVIMGMTNNIRGHIKEKQLIQRNSKNLLRLINQLLDLSKLDSGNLKLDTVQGDIVTYLQYLTESFYSMAYEKHIRLTFYPEVRELYMDYDEAKIQHIVYNLLTNAIKFTEQGGKVILHLLQLERKSKPWLQIKVSDTGVGISKDDLPLIFDRFFQGDGSSTRKEAGTGIGLALTKELVEMMGGKITVKSKEGTGTDFMVLLPIVREADTARKGIDPESLVPDFRDTPEATSSENRSVLPSITKMTTPRAELPTLLIIEDNRDVVTYFESLLKEDYQILLARNGQEGIDKALEMVPDIIVSDVMMPEKDGYEVCKALKNDEKTSHIPIILLTAKATTEDRIEGLKGGADAYLTKPFNKEELFVRLEKLLKLRKALRERYASPEWYSKTSRTAVGAELSLDDSFLQKIIKVVEDRLEDPDLAVVDLCRAANLSNTQVNRKLKALTGKTPSQFIRLIRLQKAVELLKTTDLNISEIAYEVGFNDPNYFTRSFSEEFGYPPNAIRK